MAKSENNNLQERYEQLKQNRAKYLPLWKEISRFVGIKVDDDYTYEKGKKGDVLDEYIDDPTASLSVNQAGDYMQGVVWGTGENALSIEPSDYLLQKTDSSLLRDWFDFVTNKVLIEMNHHRAGLNNALKSHFYDQSAFGTSGVGAFPNREYLNGKEENALVFRSYGIDSIAIDEGKSGLVDIIFVTYQWRVNRIIEEFASDTAGMPQEEKVKELPKEIREDYKSNNINREYTIVQAVLPREDYDPKLKGKRGTKYCGRWFVDDIDRRDIFYKEDYARLPIAIARAIKVRGEVYGRASGSMLISTIRSVNYMVGKAIETVEKIASPPLGTWNNALWGDSVLDTSAEGLTVFNQGLMGKANVPVFPVQDIGDPRGILEFLVPYLNEKITTAFKVDILLDFNAAKDMTATESMQRFVIRGKSLAGLLMQQKSELLMPLVDRVISLLWQMNSLGINPKLLPERALDLRNIGRGDAIIPDAVLMCEAEGKPWYKVKFHSELDRLSNTEQVEKIIQVLQTLSAMASLFPGILEAVEWYDMWKDVNEYLGVRYFKDEETFKKAIEAIAQRERMLISAQIGKQGGEFEKDIAQANKLNKEAEKGG